MVLEPVLETPNPSSKHARWWTKVYGSGVKNIQILYRAGKGNLNADALSRNPQGAAPCEEKVDEVQVATITSGQEEIHELLNKGVQQCRMQEDDFGLEQQKDDGLKKIIKFLTDGSLPDDSKVAKKIAAQA